MKSKPTSDQSLARRRRLALTLTGAALLAAAGYAVHPDAGPTLGAEAGIENVLIVTLDTTRADRIGCYGYEKASTPNLDAMAERGVLAENCITVAPITLPSHASILTGLYPFHHGARNNGTHRLPEEVPTLAETLSSAGFATGAVTSAFVLDSRFGLDQGFDTYDDDLANAEEAPLFMFRETKALDTAKRANRWLEERGDERWFLWMHLFDPHANYEPPEPFASRCEDPYDGEIAYADAGIGEVLETLRKRGELDKTLVIVTADHGESLGEHGESTHSIFLHDATTRVPLILMHPSLVQGKRIEEVVSSVDIVPTVLELLDVGQPAPVDGRSVARAAVLPDEVPERVPSYSESMAPWYNHGWSDLRAVRDEHGRFIEAPRPELYDLTRDPRELHDLCSASPALADRYATRLDAILPDAEVDMRGDDIRSMDPEVRASLAALGYVWTSSEEGRDPELVLPDPKDRIHLWEDNQRANELVRLERYDEAEIALRGVLSEDPASAMARSALAGVLLHQERDEEALALLRETVTMPGVRNSVVLRLAAVERDLGLETWRENLQVAKDMDPRDPLPWVEEGDWAQEDGDPETALRAYRAALELDDRCAKAWVGIGNTEHRLGREVEAEAALRRAVEADPIAVAGWYNLGVVLETLERHTEARDAYVRALRLEPDHVLSLVNLGNAYQRAGQAALAETSYRAALANEPDDFNANYNLGVLLLGTERPAAAAEVFARCAALEPEREQAWRQCAVARRASGDSEGASEASHRLARLERDRSL